ncbi:MAG: hypothetical protein SFV15_13075 [Polyangiaceae bacterium]|nr:hypothetical protein [Polyangiaceae bacterium]
MLAALSATGVVSCKGQTVGETEETSGGAASGGAASGGGASGGGASCGGPSGGAASGGGGANLASGGSGGLPTGAGGVSNAGGGIGSAPVGGSAGSMAIPFEPKPIHKLDLLFVVDNSIDMAPHQPLLAKGARELMSKLTNPDCVQAGNAAVRQRVTDGEVACPQGFAREFPPITDMHVGVITSSLGGFGSTACSIEDAAFTPRKDDAGHLIGVVNPNLPSYNSKGFWVWDPKGARLPAGESNLSSFSQAIESGILAVGATGCGYEATLEAWYRFLVNPDPFMSISQVNSASLQAGLDSSLLAQRSLFLRPDSHVAIVMLTGEDDCSILDESLGWLVGTTAIQSAGVSKTFNMIHPTSTCETEPNSPCCRSCAVLGNPPPGCQPLAADPNCQPDPSNNNSLALKAADDPANLRCFEQKRRFGLDLLQPIGRYSAALTQAMVPDRTGAMKPNGLFQPGANGTPLRNPAMVLVTSVVGVPWAAIAQDPTGAQTQLSYLKPSEFTARGIWGDILGAPEASVRPNDPLMVPSIKPRSGTSPRSGLALAPPSSTNPKGAANGHEYNPVDGDDLQYSCIYELPTPINCLMQESGCACGYKPSGTSTEQMVRDRVLAENRPICNPPAGGPAEPTQFFAGALPPPRHLSLLKAVGDQARLGSICPRYSKEDLARPASDPSFGYNPALSQIVDWVRDLPR